MALFPALCLLVLSVFLCGLGLFALALTKVIAPDGRGHTRGLIGGLASLLAVLLLCGLGLAGLTATVAVIGVGSVAEWNPIRRIEVHREPASLSGASGGASGESIVAARFTVHGNAGADLIELVHDLVDVDLADLGDGLSIRHHEAQGGDDFSVYEFRLPISEDDLKDFERELSHELGGLRVRLPESVDIRFQGVDGIH